ncbi:MAG: hypothetical protein IJW46_06480 [Clostridia bacterium]|nr:hypothetical protein [Clostridia bacterium]
MLDKKTCETTASKTDKLTERSFMQSLVVSVMGILLCIVFLTGTTWAWFSDGISSSSNTISTADCTVTVSVVNAATNETLTANAEGVYRFSKNVVYTVTMTATGSATSAYCKLVIGTDEMYTQQISTKEDNNQITFTMTFTTSDTDVTIETRWGTYHVPNDQRSFYDKESYENPKANATN